MLESVQLEIALESSVNSTFGDQKYNCKACSCAARNVIRGVSITISLLKQISEAPVSSDDFAKYIRGSIVLAGPTEHAKCQG